LLITRILVTGAAGFIGSSPVDRLLADGHQVVGIDNLSTGVVTDLQHVLRYNALSPRRFTFVRDDIQAPELPDIFHLACHPGGSSDSHQCAGNNQFAKPAGKRVFKGSPMPPPASRATEHLPVDESRRVDPLSPYPAAKLAGELYIRAAEMYGIAPICLALANVYGPRQDPHGAAAAIAGLAGARITGQPITVYGEGTAARDYVYVDDVVDAFVRAGHSPPTTVETYNKGTGRQITVT
jgi:UDP-glucose 4-epimerase